MKSHSRRKPDGYWTLERCREVWRSCSTITEFARKHSGAYDWVYKRGLLDEIRKDLSLVYKKPHWTLDRCRKAWRSCSSISEFISKYKSAYCAVSRKGWRDEMRKDFPEAKKFAYWSLENCRKAWKTCSSISEFVEKHSAAYSAVQRNDWLNQMRADFPNAQKQGGYWTLETCRDAWSCYKTISEFAAKNAPAYTAVKKNGWLKEMRESLESSRVPEGYWTLKRCKELWGACDSIADFIKKHPTAYAAVCRKGWGAKMRRDLPDSRAPNGYWTRARCRRAWRSCSSITEFVEKYSAAYTVVKRSGWLDAMRSELPTADRYTSNDIVYLWKTGLLQNRKSIYKVGVTSKRRGKKRIELVAKKHGATHTVLRFEECVDAIAIENAVLDIASPVSRIEGDGVSEMFVASVEELNRILDLLDSLVFEQTNR